MSLEGTTTGEGQGEPRRIAVIYAMEFEAAPIVASLAALPLNLQFGCGLPTRAYEVAGSRGSALIVTAGRDPIVGVDCIGTQAAAINAFLAITYYRPALVISSGTAGGFLAN